MIATTSALCEEQLRSPVAPGRENEFGRTAASNGASSSAVLHTGCRRIRCPDGGNGYFSDRNHSLGRHPVLETAQPAGAHGAQNAQAAIRDRRGAWPHLAFHPYAYLLDRGPFARHGRLARFHHAVAHHRRL